MLTTEQVRTHEALFRRLLIGAAFSVASCCLGVVMLVTDWDALGEIIGVGGVFGLLVYGWRTSLFMLKDLRLRGRSPLWAFGLSGVFGLIAWIIWRRSHPIPTKFTAGDQ